MEPFTPRLILCGTDLSEAAGHALRYAAAFAESFGARLVAVYADRFLPPPEFTARQEGDLSEALDRSRRAAREVLAAQLREHASGVPATEGVVVEELPVPAILDTARSRGADLVVLGTHGRAGFSRLWLGSVAERVLHQSPTPVLTVRPGPAGEGHARIERVLCPVNYTETAHRALAVAAGVAARFGAELLAVHVVEPGGDSESDAGERDRLCLSVPGAVRDACSVRELVHRGDAAEEILRSCRDQRCDLVVLGARHRPFFDTTVIGVTTTRVTRHAPCPVLTVASGA